MNSQPSFFIAGTMQGSRTGNAKVDQSYRLKIEHIIQRTVPDAIVLCPARQMQTSLACREREIRQEHRALADERAIHRDELSLPLLALVNTFHSLTELAGQCDVCIAYLPNHEASMGTAMEMYSAWIRGRTIIAITDMVQNLSILACSTHIIRTLDDLPSLLSGLSFPTANTGA